MIVRTSSDCLYSGRRVSLTGISYQYHVYLFYLLLNMNTTTGNCIHIHKSPPPYLIWLSSAQDTGMRSRVIAGRAFSSDDQQSHIGNDIEDQENDFEQPEERVNDYVEGFPGNGEPFALRTVHEIRGNYQYDGPKDQKASVHNCTPHKERDKCLNIHDVPPFLHLTAY
jgi:hypothetical protein